MVSEEPYIPANIYNYSSPLTTHGSQAKPFAPYLSHLSIGTMNQRPVQKRHVNNPLLQNALSQQKRLDRIINRGMMSSLLPRVYSRAKNFRNEDLDDMAFNTAQLYSSHNNQDGDVHPAEEILSQQDQLLSNIDVMAHL